MNILIYSKRSAYRDTRFGGAETSLRLIGERLAARGHRIYYLTSAGEAASEPRRVPVPNGVDLIVAPRFESSFTGRVWARLLGKRLARRRWMSRYVGALISKLEIELVYTHYELTMIESLIEARVGRDFKVVMRMAGLKWYERSRDHERKKDRYASVFNAVDSINYNTPGLQTLCHEKADEIDFPLRPRDEFVADIGAFAERPEGDGGSRPTRDAAADSAPLKIVVATRFSHYQKRQDLLIEALHRLPGECAVDVHLIGTGPELPRIEAMIAEYALEDRVRISPFLEQAALWNELCEADLLCHPCDYEGLSKIIIESMMVGLPVLASDVLPLRDYVEDERTGFLVQNTPEDWAAKIELLARNRERLREVGRAGSVYARSSFDTDTNVIRYEEHFERLLGQGKHRSV